MNQWRFAVAVVALSLFSSPAGAQRNPAQAPSGPPRVRLEYDWRTQIPATPFAATVRDGFTFAGVGDIIAGRPVVPLQDPEFEGVVRIIRGASAAMANAEVAIFDRTKFNGWAYYGGNGNPNAAAGVARDLKDMGFDFLARPNNHSGDYGVEGLIETSRILDEAGVLHAGFGMNRAEARMPVYMETPQGRVALVAAVSTLPGAHVFPGNAVNEAPARPGVSILRTTRTTVVSPQEFALLQQLAALRSAGGRGGRGGRGGGAGGAGNAATQISVLGQTYRLGEKPGVTTTMNDLDRYEILQAVRGARQTSDITVFTIHAHEEGVDGRPADFLTELYHNVIDAGADIVIAHGQRSPGGVEVYKGKPIFHAVGSFFFQQGFTRGADLDLFENQRIDPRGLTHGDMTDARFGNNPPDWYQGIIAMTEFAAGKVKEVRIYPLDLRPGRNINTRGVPRLATGATAQTILGRVQERSRLVGTNIRVENGVGVIRPGT